VPWVDFLGLGQHATQTLTTARLCQAGFEFLLIVVILQLPLNSAEASWQL
jgi:hypothetical protein